MEFKKDLVLFKAASSNGKLLLKIDINKTNHYYCKNEKNILVETKILYKIKYSGIFLISFFVLLIKISYLALLNKFSKITNKFNTMYLLAFAHTKFKL